MFVFIVSIEVLSVRVEDGLSEFKDSLPTGVAANAKQNVSDVPISLTPVVLRPTIKYLF